MNRRWDRLRQPGVTYDSADVIQGQSKHVGGDLRENGKRAGADVLGPGFDHGGAVGAQPHVGARRRVPESSHRATRHALADAPVTVALRTARPLAPAEQPCALLVGFPQFFRRPGLAGRRILLRVVGQTQVERIDAQRIGEFVHGAFQRPQPRTLHGGPHRGRHRHVGPLHTQRRCQCRGGIHRARRFSRIFGKVVGDGRQVDALVVQSAKPSCSVGGQRHLLRDAGLIAEEGVHVSPATHEFDWPANHLGRRSRKDGWRPHKAFQAESAAGVRTEHPHLVGLHVE